MERNIRYKIAAILGKTGSGKDSVFKAIEETDKIHKVISTTTRPMREYEEDGVDYHFIDRYDFLEMDNRDQFLDTSVFNGWYYGTNINDLQEDKVNVIIADNSRLLDLLTDKQVDTLIVFIESSPKERLLRCLTREEDPDVSEIVRRYVAEEEDYDTKEFQLINRYVRPALTIPNHDGQLDSAIERTIAALNHWAN